MSVAQDARVVETHPSPPSRSVKVPVDVGGSSASKQGRAAMNTCLGVSSYIPSLVIVPKTSALEA